MMKLSKRLQAVADYAAPCMAVADVGTDHGYLPIHLVGEGLAERAFALDVRPGPLSRAREHILAHGLAEKIELRQGDGLEKLLPGEADTIVIAGMGGSLTVRILRDGLGTAKCARRLVLSPQSELYGVRRFLQEEGFLILDENMVCEEGKFYPVLCARYSPGEKKAEEPGFEEELHLRFGRKLLEKKSPVLRKYLLKEREKYRKVAETLRAGATESKKKRLGEVERELALIEEGLTQTGKTITQRAKMPLSDMKIYRGGWRDMKIKELIGVLEELAPPRLALDWDNVGLLAGREDQELTGVYLALDVTEASVRGAAAGGCNMLLTHHPLLFHGVKRINDGNFIGRRILNLVEHGISHYAMHTNYDCAPGCMADQAAALLGLEDGVPLEPLQVAGGAPYGIGKVGVLGAPLALKDLCGKVKRQFDIPALQVFQAAGMDQKVSRVAISPGSGKSMIPFALKAGAEVLVTGDIGHHEGIDAVAQGLTVIDAGHYGIEHIFIPHMAGYLRKKLGAEIKIVEEKLQIPFITV